MSDTCHPVLYEMGKLGCKNVLKSTIAFQIYIELCEAKRLWDVEYKYNKSLDLIYLEARTSKSSPLQKYVPWPAMNPISLNEIEHMQKELESERLVLVFIDGDSTTVYYCVSSGLVKPSSPEQSKAFKHKEEKKTELDNEIRKNAANLYELAISIRNEENASTNSESAVNENTDV